MSVQPGVVFFAFFSASILLAAPPEAAQISLSIPAGVPLRLYLTRRAPKKPGALVEAKVLEPVYAFDRLVIPAGAVVRGRVSRVQPVSKAERVRAVLGGDFTPLHAAPIEFTTLVLPDGRTMPLETTDDVGLNSLVQPRRAAKSKPAALPQNTGVLGTGKQKVEDAIRGQVDRARSIPDLIRGPDKKEKLEDYLLAKLPYHPQYVRKGTRFDAILREPLNFGSEPASSLAPIGMQPPPDAVAHARLITALDSASAKPGEPVEAVLAEPVYSADHKLILPEGTRLEGAVVAARRARWLHRSGQLRFNFREIELPEEMARLEASEAEAAAAPASHAALTQPPLQEKLKVRTQAHLDAAESTGKAALKVDHEGGVQAKESKTRFIAAAAAVMVARSAGDNDPIRNQNHQIVGQSQNVGGRTIGGAFGFGLLGAAVSQSSRWVGSAFGYYGMAWSLYETLIARGSEVQFGKNAMVDVRFDTRSEEAGTARPAAPAAVPAVAQ